MVLFYRWTLVHTGHKCPRQMHPKPRELAGVAECRRSRLPCRVAASLDGAEARLHSDAAVTA